MVLFLQISGFVVLLLSIISLIEFIFTRDPHRQLISLLMVILLTLTGINVRDTTTRLRQAESVRDGTAVCVALPKDKAVQK